MERKYLLLFHCWDSGCYSHVCKHVTRIIEASPDEIEEKIEEATMEVNDSEKRDVCEEAFVLQQVIRL